MKTFETETITAEGYYIPTREFVESLTEGDEVIDFYGHIEKVTRVYGRGNDVNGKAFVCFYVSFGENAEMSQTFKEGELVTTWPLMQKHTSAELREIAEKLQEVQ